MCDYSKGVFNDGVNIEKVGTVKRLLEMGLTYENALKGAAIDKETYEDIIKVEWR